MSWDVTVKLRNRRTGEKIEDEFWIEGGPTMLKREITEIKDEEYGKDWDLIEWKEVNCEGSQPSILAKPSTIEFGPEPK